MDPFTTDEPPAEPTPRAPPVELKPEVQTMQDVLFETKSYIRQFMIENFSRFKEIINAPEPPSNEEVLRKLALDKKRLYLPSTQAMVINKSKSSGTTFIQFQELLQQQIEKAFEQTGIMQKVTHLEKQNFYLYQAAMESENFKKFDIAIGGDGDGSGYTQDFQNLKLNIMKRVKKNLQTNKKESTMVPNKAFDEKYEFPAQKLINEDKLFENIQNEMFDAIFKQTAIIEKNYAEKFDRMNKINLQLRKSCMQELQVLRETYFQAAKGTLSQPDARMYESTHIFNVEQGLDKDICDLLNTKIRQVSIEYTGTIAQQKDYIEVLTQKIKKYQALTPKTFKFAELSIEEVMETMAILYDDSFYVWKALTGAYPKDFFLGCIEDQYGSFFDTESESKMQTRMIQISSDLRKKTQEISKTFVEQKEQIYQEFKEYASMIDHLKESYEKRLKKIEKDHLDSVDAMLSIKVMDIKSKHDVERLILKETIDRNQAKYKQLKELHHKNEAKLSFFKWKVITQAFKQHQKTDLRKLKKILVNDNVQKLKNSMQSKDEKLKLYKNMFEESRRDFVSVSQQYNYMLEENVKIINKYNLVKSDMEGMFQEYTTNIIPKLNHLKAENKTLKTQLYSALNLVEQTRQQKELIEDKYNISDKKSIVDPKERVLYKMLGEFQIEYDSTIILIEKQINEANEYIPGKQPISQKFNPLKQIRDCFTQTNLQNVYIDIKYDVRLDMIGRKPEQIPDLTFEQECQTDYDFEKFEEDQDELESLRELERLRQEQLASQTTEQNSKRTDLSKRKSKKGQGHYNKKKGYKKGHTEVLSACGDDQSFLGIEENENQENQQIQIEEVDKDHGHAKSDKLSNSSGHESPQKQAEDASQNFKNLEIPIPKRPLSGSGKRTIEIMNPTDNISSKSSNSALTSNNMKPDSPILSPPNKHSRRNSIEPIQKSIDNLEPLERFDRLKFIFETNIDIVEALKKGHPSLYSDIVKKLKNDLIKSNLTRENQKLFSSNKEWLKRLYPKNQPEVYQRLQKTFDEKEERRVQEMKMKERAKWQMASKTKNDEIKQLQDNLEKAIRSKSKKKVKQAQIEMIKSIRKINKYDKYDVKSEPSQERSKDININITHTNIVNINEQTNLQGVKLTAHQFNPNRFGNQILRQKEMQTYSPIMGRLNPQSPHAFFNTTQSPQMAFTSQSPIMDMAQSPTSSPIPIVLNKDIIINESKETVVHNISVERNQNNKVDESKLSKFQTLEQPPQEIFSKIGNTSSSPSATPVGNTAFIPQVEFEEKIIHNFNDLSVQSLQTYAQQNMDSQNSTRQPIINNSGPSIKSPKNREVVLSKKQAKKPNLVSEEFSDLSKMAAEMNLLMQQRQQLEILKQSQQYMSRINDTATADMSSSASYKGGNFRRNRPMTTKNNRGNLDPRLHASFNVTGTSYHSSRLQDILRQQQQIQHNLNSMSFQMASQQFLSQSQPHITFDNPPTGSPDGFENFVIIPLNGGQEGSFIFSQNPPMPIPNENETISETTNSARPMIRKHRLQSASNIALSSRIPKTMTNKATVKAKQIQTHRGPGQNPNTGSSIRTTSSFGTSLRMRKGGGFNPRSSYVTKNFTRPLVQTRDNSKKDNIFEFKPLAEEKIHIIDENEDNDPVVHKIPHLDDFFIQ